MTLTTKEPLAEQAEQQEEKPLSSGELGEQIQEELGVAKSTFLKYRKELERLGYDVTSTKGKTGNKSYYSPDQIRLIKNYCGMTPEQRADFPKAGTITQQEEPDDLNYRQPQPSSPRTGKDRAIESWELGAAEELIYKDYLVKTGNFSNRDLWADVEIAREKIHQHQIGQIERPQELADRLLGKLEKPE
jgi:biotin operon repressor